MFLFDLRLKLLRFLIAFCGCISNVTQVVHSDGRNSEVEDGSLSIWLAALILVTAFSLMVKRLSWSFDYRSFAWLLQGDMLDCVCA